MNLFKKISVILLLVFVGIQFIPTERNQSEEPSASDISSIYRMPENIHSLLKTSCYDCHSNNTDYPWYGSVQPFAWLLEGHIEEARAELNLSEFGLYSERRRKSKLKSMVSQLETGDMPLFSYTLLHADAKLSEKDKTLLVNWLSELKESL